MTATQRSGFHQLGPVGPMPHSPACPCRTCKHRRDRAREEERDAALAICARAQSPGDAVLLLAMCGLLPEHAR